MLNTVEMADSYFATSFLSASAWEAIDDDDKTLLLETAERDINAYLQTNNIDEDVINAESPFTPYQTAIFEWALYLYKNKDVIEVLINDKGIGVSEIQIDGIGKEVYSNSKKPADAYNSMIERCPAGRFLRMIYPDRRIVR